LATSVYAYSFFPYYLVIQRYLSYSHNYIMFCVKDNLYVFKKEKKEEKEIGRESICRMYS